MLLTTAFEYGQNFGGYMIYFFAIYIGYEIGKSINDKRKGDVLMTLQSKIKAKLEERKKIKEIEKEAYSEQKVIEDKKQLELKIEEAKQRGIEKAQGHSQLGNNIKSGAKVLAKGAKIVGAETAKGVKAYKKHRKEKFGPGGTREQKEMHL